MCKSSEMAHASLLEDRGLTRQHAGPFPDGPNRVTISARSATAFSTRVTPRPAVCLVNYSPRRQCLHRLPEQLMIIARIMQKRPPVVWEGVAISRQTFCCSVHRFRRIPASSNDPQREPDGQCDATPPADFAHLQRLPTGQYR